MSRKTDYTSHEWLKLLSLGMIAMSYKLTTLKLDSVSRAIGLAREIIAFNSFISESCTKYEPGTLVSDFVNDMKPNVQETCIGVGTGKQLDLAGTVAVANEILARKATPDEANSLRAFVYELSLAVINAAGEGFLSTGNPVSPSEVAFLHDLKQALLAELS